MLVQAGNSFRKYTPSPDFILVPRGAKSSSASPSSTVAPSSPPDTVTPSSPSTTVALSSAVASSPAAAPAPTLSSGNAKPGGFCPILLGEVISNSKESDRWRMLLQLAVCARVNALVCKAGSDPLIVQGVYLNADYEVERYLAYADIKVGSDLADCQASHHLLYGRTCTRGHRKSISAAILFPSEPRKA